MANFGLPKLTWASQYQSIGSLEELQGFDAILLGMGTMKPQRLGVEGEELPGVVECLDFLKAVNVNHPTPEEAIQEACRCVRCDLWRIHGVPPVWPRGKKF